MKNTNKSLKSTKLGDITIVHHKQSVKDDTGDFHPYRFKKSELFEFISSKSKLLLLKVSEDLPDRIASDFVEEVGISNMIFFVLNKVIFRSNLLLNALPKLSFYILVTYQS